MNTETIDGRDPVSLLKGLIACPSVTPDEGGAIALLDGVLSAAGFETHTVVFSEPGTPDITNFFAKIGSGAPHFCFAGHTDVVAPGNAAAWSHGPFEGAIAEGRLYGRGAVDMKGGIAAFVAASLDYLAAKESKGTISLLITGDEEGPATNGTVKLLDWAKARGERIDACIVGEPTNPNVMGEMIKVGRRGSLSGTVSVKGRQGHVAYPHLADNPVPKLAKLVASVTSDPLDRGNARFQPSNLEFISFDVGNTAWNVIPGEARARFNIRFNDEWSRETLDALLRQRLTEAAGNAIDWTLTLEPTSSDSFLTHDARLIETLAGAIEATVGRRPELSTSGGTSDARFIKNHCPVVEFGLVGQTMHQVDENVAIADLEALTRVYRRFLEDYFRA